MPKHRQIFLLGAAAVASGFIGILAYRCITNASQRNLLYRKRKEIIIISSEEEYRQCHTKLCDELEHFKILGLDCEWMTDEKRRPVSMLQLSTQTGYCLLIRIHLFKNIPEELSDLLSDRNILKCGVGITCDARYLCQDYHVVVQGCVDLRHVFMRTKKTKFESKLSLSGLAFTVLGVEMDKRQHVRCSDWEAETLRPEQVEYAAMDALVAADIMTRLVVSKMSSTQSSVDCFQRKLFSLVQGVMDVDFKQSKIRPKKHAAGIRLKDKPSNAYKSRKEPLYENAQLHAPDGQLLCTCSTSKAKWYVEKEIGEYVSTDPITVRLLFEPSGRPESSNNYYTLDKSNICVVCGVEDTHIRKHIIPKEYRKFFPAVMKEHKSHDILLLCIRCHRLSGVYDSVLRQRFATECDAPIAAGDARFTVDKELDNIRSCARALLRSRDRIPPERVQVLEQTIRDYYHVTDVTEDLLQMASDVKTQQENESYVAHGMKVVRHVMEHGGLIYFERTWRQHFLDTMKPEHLPEMWRVDHNHERLTTIDQEIRTNPEFREELWSNFGEL